MEITVKLFNEMKSYAPGQASEFRLNLNSGATVADVLARLAIPPDKQKVVLLDGHRATETMLLTEQATLVMFPPIDGG